MFPSLDRFLQEFVIQHAAGTPKDQGKKMKKPTREENIGAGKLLEKLLARGLILTLH